MVRSVRNFVFFTRLKISFMLRLITEHLKEIPQSMDYLFIFDTDSINTLFILEIDTNCSALLCSALTQVTAVKWTYINQVNRERMLHF